jgi:DHA2 family methylenomycin A resistance protein-like MFS transporter
MLPLFLPLACLAPLTGRLVARIGAKLPMIAGLLVSALGVLLLLRLQSDTAYPLLLAAMLPWGIGMAILTPAVVAAAVAAVPSERSGLASAVNNTARQAGGAIGIAAFGALAGSPGDQGEFLSGFHLAALIGACLWIAMAVGCLLLVPVAARPGSRRGGARRLRLIEET